MELSRGSNKLLLFEDASLIEFRVDPIKLQIVIHGSMAMPPIKNERNFMLVTPEM
tara:strand:- start:555 stop:719 length:165 start_codon:yes stop_codon:yes gene_type:complete